MREKIYLSILLVFMILAVDLVLIDICLKYYKCNYYSPDPGSNMFHNVTSYYNLKNISLVSFITGEFYTNTKSPLPVIFCAMVYKKLLILPYGHIVYSSILLLIYLLLLTDYLRYKGIPLIHNVITCLIILTTGIISATYVGLAFNLPDNMASWSIGGSVICILQWIEVRKSKWIFLAAILISISVLTRYIFCVYAFIVIFPVILVTSIQEIRKNNFLFIKDILLFVTTLLILCGGFILIHFKDNFAYYTYFSKPEQGTQGISLYKSSISFIYSFKQFLTKSHIIIIILIFILIFNGLKNIKVKWEIIFRSIWISSALPLFWIFYLKTNGFKVFSAFWPSVPLFYLAIFYLYSQIHQSTKLSIRRGIFLVCALLSIVLFIRRYPIITNSLTAITESKQTDTLIAQTYLRTLDNSIPQPDTIGDVIGDFHTLSASLELEYNHNIFFYSSRNTPWLFHTTNSNNSITKILNRRFIVAFDNLDMINKNTYFYGDSSARNIAYQVTSRLITDNRYIKLKNFKIDSSLTGTIYLRKEYNLLR